MGVTGTKLCFREVILIAEWRVYFEMALPEVSFPWPELLRKWETLGKVGRGGEGVERVETSLKKQLSC